MTGAGLSSRSWLRHEPTEAAGPGCGCPARAHLVCLPHAGAGAASFNRWLGLFPPTVAAVRVRLPGREDIAAEPPLRRVRDAVDGLLPQIAELGDTPVALYGHSMGALVAFELARALSVAGTPPVHLFVSGRRAPHLPARRAPIHHLPDDEFAAALEAMGAGGAARRSPAFLRYALRLVKADLELSEEYTYSPEPGLHCPVTVFYGTEDPVVAVDEIEAWQAETDRTFAIRAFPGDHFFHQRHRATIVACMTEALE